MSLIHIYLCTPPPSFFEDVVVLQRYLVRFYFYVLARVVITEGTCTFVGWRQGVDFSSLSWAVPGHFTFHISHSTFHMYVILTVIRARDLEIPEESGVANCYRSFVQR